MEKTINNTKVSIDDKGVVTIYKSDFVGSTDDIDKQISLIDENLASIEQDINDKINLYRDTEQGNIDGLQTRKADLLAKKDIIIQALK